MILRRCLALRTSIFRKSFARNAAISGINIRSHEFSAFTSCYCTVKQVRQEILSYQSVKSTLLLHRKWYSKGLQDDVGEAQREKELQKITELFPEARVALHILSTRTPDKIYDIHYKQHTAGKKAIRNNEWTCTYKFIWPEKIKFESTSISKRQAAEKAATQALHWLYINKRIDSHGHPIYEKSVIEDIKSNLTEPITAEISGNSVEKIQKIWKEYESGIKQMYEKTAEQARLKTIEVPSQLTKDSTIDQEDEFPEDEDVGEQMGVTSETKGPIHPVYGRVLKQPTAQALRRRGEALERTFAEYDRNISPLPIDEYAIASQTDMRKCPPTMDFITMYLHRMLKPKGVGFETVTACSAFERSQITSTIESNRVCVIVGAAGCGKSTRVPAAILRQCRVDAAVVVSEPRRVAAIGLAERVASELSEDVGESVGYQVRLHSKPPRPPAGSVLYCTSGVLLNRLHNSPGLEGCSHVIIDEAHERDVNTDVTLLLLKRAMQANPRLKLVVMSATLDTAVFTEYFDSCPVIEVPGRTYPVQISYLQDIQKKYNLQLPCTMANSEKEDGRPLLNITEVTEVIKAIDKHEKEGAILVFLPGWAEIKQAKQILDSHYANSTLHIILPVHSRLSTADQTKMFLKPPPGVRKIVLSTNVAETSVTVPDVLHVVDAGAHKAHALREGTGTSSLETVWVSLAAANQRCGRAGRVQPGYCYRLYTKEREATFVPHTTPEILRVPLEQTVLDCKTYAPQDKALDFLSQLPEPPSAEAVQCAVNLLTDIGALTESEHLTRLGGYISQLPLSPRVALAVLRATSACCTLPAANMAVVCDANTELFANAADRREEIRGIKRQFNQTSDHVALHWIQHEFENELHSTDWRTVDEWCDKYTLKKERLGYVKSISSLYLRELLKSGLIEKHLELDDINRFADIDELSVATLFSGVDALLVSRRHVRTKGKLKTVNEVFTTTGDRAHIASESVNYALTKRCTKPTLVAYYGGHHSTERRALMVYKSSVISPQAVILFSIGQVDETENDGETAVLSIPRHRLSIHVPAGQSEVLLKAREMLWSTFNYHIDRDTRDLEYDDVTTIQRFKIRLLKATCRMLIEANDYSEGKKRNVEDFG